VAPDDAEGYPRPDFLVHAVEMQSGHAGEYLEVFDPCKQVVKNEFYRVNKPLHWYEKSRNKFKTAAGEGDADLRVRDLRIC
jgi:hypothetical protein